VVRITGDFQQERVLHPAAIALLPQFFTTAWADPSKLNISSRQVNIILEQVRQSFAKALNVRSDEIEFLGEPDLGFQLGITGLLNAESKLFYSSIDRQKVFAITANEKNNGRPVTELPVSSDGMIQESGIGSDDLLIWQVANGETGNIQNAPKGGGNIFADCTSSGVDLLPNFNYQTALFDSRSWAGPAGVGILVIKSSASWRNPLPHNDLSQPDNRAQLKNEIISFIKEQIPDVDIASSANSLGKFLSISIKGIEADRLLLDLEDQGFAVDSGSACKSADMKPSHVLAAMGRPITGNIRLTIHKEITSEIVKDFCQALKTSVSKLRSN